MKTKENQAVIIVTAYGEDNYYQKRYEDIVGIYTSVKNAIFGALEDGMTNRQGEKLCRTNAFYWMEDAIKNGKGGTWQVDYEEETDARRKPCTSSYQFKIYYLDK